MRSSVTHEAIAFLTALIVNLFSELSQLGTTPKEVCFSWNSAGEILLHRTDPGWVASGLPTASLKITVQENI